MSSVINASAAGASEPVCPTFRVDGAHALITGAGKGLGRAAARALARAGAHVYVLARTSADVEGVCDQVRAAGGVATPVVADVTDREDRRRAFACLPRLDILVNSAGTNIPESALTVSEEHLDRMLELNVRAAFLMAQGAARKMIEQGTGGAIINLSSQMGHVGAVNRAVYCMTKHAVEGMTKSLALELAPNAIRVNSVAPTFIETDMTRPFLADPKFREWVLDRLPIGRIGREEDVVGAIVYLASPAAALVSGTSLIVDGGWTAQ